MEGRITSSIHLSLYLFNLVLDVLSKDLRYSAPDCMFFNGIVLIEKLGKVKSKLELWKEPLEIKGFV